MQEDSICGIVRSAEEDYTTGTTRIGKYVDFSMYETIERIDAYSNSKHISGAEDSLGREKPFFNIVTSAMNIWYRATDIDRKDIRILPDRLENTALAFVTTVLLQNWMKESRFGVFLNQWGRALAKYCSAVVKFVEKDGKLVASVVPWNRFIADPVDFNGIPHIEKFYKTEAQLYKLAREAGYDLEVVDALCKARSSRKNLDGTNKDDVNDFIELYEVHGELSKALYKKSKGEEVVEGDEDIFFQQMHVVSFVAGDNDEYQDFTLFSGREKKDPYMITHLIEEDGRTLAIGAVEYLFDAQWMQNHTIKNQKDVLDLASKLIFQTSDSAYLGRNVLSAIESGDIMIHKENMPLTQINNSKADIVALQNFGEQWRILASDLTSTPDALRGNTLPSGTPYSLGALLSQNSSSLFEIMTENKGLAIEDMMREFVLPYLKKQMDNKDEVVAVLDDAGLTEIDSMYVPKQAIKEYNKQFKESLMRGELPDEFNQQAMEGAVRESLAPLGNKRYLKPDELDEKTWKDSIKDFEMKATVEVTTENTDKQAVLTTLSTVLQSIASNPTILQDPNAKMVFGKILEQTSVISPMQLATTTNQPVPTASPPTVEAGALPVIS